VGEYLARTREANTNFTEDKIMLTQLTRLSVEADGRYAKRGNAVS